LLHAGATDRGGGFVDFGLIDCDFHPAVDDTAAALDPYLTAAQKDRLAWLGVGPEIPVLNFRPPGRAHHFTDGIRQDCVPPNGGSPGSDIDHIRAHHLDPHGVAAAVLIPIQPAVVDSWTYADEAAWFVSAYNDHFCDHWLAVEPRFNLDMLVSPLDVDLAVKEIERVGPRDGVVGVWLPMTDRLYGHRSWYPVYEAALEHDLAIMVHPMSADDVVGTAARAGGIPTHYAERYALQAQFGMSHIASLVFEGVFERYPRLRFSFVEFGWMWVGPLLWRMDAVYKAARRHHPWMTKSPTETILEHVRFTTEPALECPNEWLEQSIAIMRGAETLMYSSDYPHWDSEEPWVPFKHIDDELRRRIFRENALEFFGDRLRRVEPAAVAA
jgi:predicted TIM-barrel fold metal-dependent hydrolase